MNTIAKAALGVTAAMLFAFGIEAAYIHYDVRVRHSRLQRRTMGHPIQMSWYS